MARFCVFGSHQGLLPSEGGVYVTIFGGSELKRSPIAGQLADRQHQTPAKRNSPRSAFFFTLFGNTTIIWPTLAEEYLALRDALRAGVLTLADWDRLIGRGGGDSSPDITSFSLFAGFESDKVPTEDKELDELSLQRHLGQIPDQAADVLMLAIGQTGPQRMASVRQAAATALSSGG